MQAAAGAGGGRAGGRPGDQPAHQPARQSGGQARLLQVSERAATARTLDAIKIGRIHFIVMHDRLP